MNLRIVAITGANRGIGFSILQALATRSPANIFILTARSAETISPAIEQLRALGITSVIDGQVLDVTSDQSIAQLETKIREKYGKLDVLINNAGIALIPSDLSSFRLNYTTIFNTNITSVAILTTALLPLLKASITSSDSFPPLVINISSARASLHLSTSAGLPPTASIPYSVSKTALNALTAEMAKADPEVRFHVVSPGHCKTAFNGYRGKKDPLDGAKVVVEVVDANSGDKGLKSGFWEWDDAEGLKKVPW